MKAHSQKVQSKQPIVSCFGLFLWAYQESFLSSVVSKSLLTGLSDENSSYAASVRTPQKKPPKRK